MKSQLIPVLALAALMGAAPLAQADSDAKNDRLTAKARKADSKFFMKRQKKALSIVKAIHDNKGAERAYQQVQKLYGLGGPSNTAMGSTKDPTAPGGKLDLDEKSQEQYNKLMDSLSTEEGRIRDEGVDSKKLDDLLLIIRNARP